LIRTGQVTPVELVEAAIIRIEKLDPELNAVIHPLFEKALDLARSLALPDAPFRGVPMVVKDLICHTAGDPFHEGMRFLMDLGWVEQEDTYLATKFRAAGFVFVGKTNVPELGDLMAGLDVQHVLTRSVRDSAAILDLVAGPMPGDPYAAPPPVRPFAEEVGADPGRLRIGFFTDAPCGTTDTLPDCLAAVEAVARLLESLGHSVEPSAPEGMGDPEYISQFLTLWASGFAWELDRWSHKTGKRITAGDVEPLTWALAEMGWSYTRRICSRPSSGCRAGRAGWGSGTREGSTSFFLRRSPSRLHSWGNSSSGRTIRSRPSSGPPASCRSLPVQRHRPAGRLPPVHA